jgi:hypothetical protein
MAHFHAVRHALTLDAARAAADRLINTYRREFRAAVTCLEVDRDALQATHRVPVRHRIRVGTTDEIVNSAAAADGCSARSFRPAAAA